VRGPSNERRGSAGPLGLTGEGQSSKPSSSDSGESCIVVVQKYKGGRQLGSCDVPETAIIQRHQLEKGYLQKKNSWWGGEKRQTGAKEEDADKRRGQSDALKKVKTFTK